MKIKMKNRSHRYDLGLDMDTNIVNIRSVSGDEIGTKQHLSNIWSLIHAKEHSDWVEKTVAYKKSVYLLA